MTALPRIALSIRQPWAWAVIHAGKDVENRSVFAMKFLGHRGRVAVHASKGMTQDEYDEARAFMCDRAGVQCPPPADLERGGMIGSIDVWSSAKWSDSVWWCGPRALLLAHALPHPFVGAVGQLGFFEWRPSGAPPESPARWMLRDAAVDLFCGSVP